MLDNGSRDGSAQAAREHPAVDEVIALRERRGKALNDSELMRRARGRYALLLNEDSELQPGATLALWRALQAHPGRGLRGRAAAAPRRLASRRAHGAFRRSRPRSRGRCSLHRLYTVQSRGEHTREVDWCQSSALLVRVQAAAQVGYMDPDFFVYSDEVDFARRLRDAGWRSLYVPRRARDPPRAALDGRRRPSGGSSELARNRDLYMRKHHSAGAARAVRWLTAWAYALRALAALALPGHSPRRYWRHVAATLRPGRGEGLREAAERVQPRA